MHNSQPEITSHLPHKSRFITPHFMITIILLFFNFFLGTYGFIYYQTLTQMEKQIAQQTVNLQTTKAEISRVHTEVEREFKVQNNDFLNQMRTQIEPLISTPHHSGAGETETLFQPANPQKFLSFNQLIGFKEELKSAQSFLNYFKNKSNYQGIGEVEPPSGMLMYGIPGTGKTTLARALAKETNLPFFEIASSTFSQKYKGLAPQMVKDLFVAAREEANRNNGAIIFLDECETIFTDLGTLEAGSEIANVVNQFKTEMTSFENNPEKPIFIIGATNHIDQIDEAIKSRFIYNIEVKPGNQTERKQFLEFMINKRQNPYSAEAKKYLLEVINAALDRLPPHQEFLKANRTLENLLKTTVTNFVQNRGTGENKRNYIEPLDLKQAYQMLISPDTTALDPIANPKSRDTN